LVMYPEVQQRAHDEFNKLILDRLPKTSDRQATLYINAVLKETLRWHPLLPLVKVATPHTTIVIPGHLVPKNTITITNIWAVSRIPNAEFSPEDFIPERFL
ncbi:cytochrome P450, partial [Mycena rebaudengoi]